MTVRRAMIFNIFFFSDDAATCYIITSTYVGTGVSHRTLSGRVGTYMSGKKNKYHRTMSPENILFY